MNSVTEKMAEAIHSSVVFQYQINREWESAKDMLEGLDCVSVANRAIEEILRILRDPVNVHINTLQGKIAKMTPEMVRHVYPELFNAE